MPVMGVSACVDAPVVRLRVETHPRVHEQNPDPAVVEEAQQVFPWAAHVSWCGIRFRADEVVSDDEVRTSCVRCTRAREAAGCDIDGAGARTVG